MNNDESPHPTSDTFPASLPSLEVLEMLANELKRINYSIMGWAEILATPNAIELNSQAIDRIRVCSDAIRQLLDDALEYAANQKAAE